MGRVADGGVDRQAASKQKVSRQTGFSSSKLCLTNCQDLLPEALNRARKTPIGFTTWIYRKTNKTNM